MNVCRVGYTANFDDRREAWLKHRPAWRMITLGIYPARESALEHEEWWIARLRGMGYPLTNIHRGGLKPFLRLDGVPISLQQRAKMSIAHKGKKRPDLSAIQAGKQHSSEWKANISASLAGHEVSRERRARISAGLRKFHASK